MSEIQTAPNNAFAAWLQSNKISCAEARRRLEAMGHQYTYERIRRLMQPLDHPQWQEPSFTLMAAISQLTEGKVTPNDWAPPLAFPHLRQEG